MKTKYVWLMAAAIIAAGGAWGGRLAWRAHRQIVSLHVRNMPLAEVLRKIESQTWKRIDAENGFDARISLNLRDKPLSYVLDRVAEQAGAQWSTIYAVYDSKRSVVSLESALKGDGKLEPAGWTKIAPDIEMLKMGGLDGGGDRPPQGPGPQVQPFPSDAGRVVTKTEDAFI